MTAAPRYPPARWRGAGTGSLSTIGAITVGGGTFDLGGNSQTTAGVITISGGTTQNGTLVNNNSNYALTNAGTISAVLNGTVGLDKSGGGTATLSGANGYAGNTSINAGVLLINASNNLGSATNSIIFGGGTLGTLVGLTEARNINMTANGTIDTWGGVNSTFSGIISGTGDLTKGGNGTLTLSGSNAGYSGQINVNVNNIAVGNAGTSTIVIGNANALGTGILNLNGGTIDTTPGGVASVSNPTTWSNSFGFGGSDNFTFSNTTAISIAADRTITLGGSGKTLTFAARVTNTADANRTLTFNGAGNMLSLAGVDVATTATATIRTLTINGTGNMTITGSVANLGTAAGGSLTYSGLGRLTLQARTVSAPAPRKCLPAARCLPTMPTRPSTIWAPAR